MIFPLIALVAAAFALPSVTTSATVPLLSHTPQTLEEYVREYYRDEPILAEIARCESHFRHLTVEGEVVRGKVNNFDVGVMQINTAYHGEKAEELGHDLLTLEGNLSYAKDLYKRQGTTPWASSASCWKKRNT